MKKRILLFFVFIFCFSLITADDFGLTNVPSQLKVINYNNYTINGTTVQHNDLSGLQGGALNEYYHLAQTPFNNVQTYSPFFSSFINSTSFLALNTTLVNYIAENNLSLVNYIAVQNTSLVNYVGVQNTSLVNYIGVQNKSLSNYVVDYVGIQNTSLVNYIAVNNASVENYIVDYVSIQNTSLVNYIAIQNTSLVNYITVQNDSLKNYLLGYVDTQNTSLRNYIDSNFYTQAEVQGINTSMKNYADSTFAKLSGGNSISGQQDFNGGWTSNGLSIINGDLYAQSVFAYNFSGLNVYDVAVNGSLLPTITNSFDVGNSTFAWRNGYFSKNLTIDPTHNALFVDSNKVYVGIGTADPQKGLHLFGTGGIEDIKQSKPFGSDIFNWTLDVGASGEWRILSNDSDQYFTILPGGNVGIGTTAPGYKLDVSVANSGGTSKQTVARFGQASQNTLELNMYGGSTDLVQFAAINGEQNIALVTEATGSVSASTTKGIYIQSGGNVGIGTTAPGANLEVTGTYASQIGQIYVNADASNHAYLSMNTPTANYDSGVRFQNGADNKEIVLFMDSSESDVFNVWTTDNGRSLSVTQGGNVGIGTTDPGYLTHIVGGTLVVSDTGGSLSGDGGSNDGTLITKSQILNYDSASFSVGTRWDDPLHFKTDNTERMTILPTSGNVGIGTTAPSQKLDVAGNAKTYQYYTNASKGVTASGTSCTITEITGGIITGATCS